jgi:hypothetical protein
MAKKENSRKKPGKFAKKQNKIPFLIPLTVAILAAALIGWFALSDKEEPPAPTDFLETTVPSESDAPVESTTPAESTSQEATEPTVITTEPIVTEAPTTAPDPLADFRHIFELYRRAVSEKWDYIACEENQICYMVMFQEDLSRLGYTLIDLNGDGNQELILSDGNVIYDLYATVQGQTVRVLTGGERNSFQLTADNRIVNRGSNGAASFIYNILTWDGAQTVTERSIIFDDMQNDRWVTTYGDQREVLTEEAAMALIDSYQVIRIPAEPIP